MEKRVLLAVILSFVVLYAFQALFPPPKPAPKPAAAARASSAASPATPAVTTPAAPAPAGGQPAAAVPEQVRAAAPLVADPAERDIVVENRSVRAVFTTRGGVLKSWRLKKYQDTAREPLELVPQAVPAGTPRPFTLQLGDAAATATLSNALFKPSADNMPGDLRKRIADVRLPGRERSERAKAVLLQRRIALRHRLLRDSVAGGKAGRPDDRVGSRHRQRHRDVDAVVQSAAAADLLSRRERQPHQREQGRGERGAAGIARVRRRRRSLLPRRRASRGPPRARGVPDARRSRPRGARAKDPASVAHFVDWSLRFDDSPNSAVLRRAEGLRRARRRRSRSRALDRLRHVRVARRSAAPRAEVGQRLRRQLRLVDHHPDGPHQRRDVPAAPQERRLDAEDAGDPAGGEGDPGSLREPEDDAIPRSRR